MSADFNTIIRVMGDKKRKALFAKKVSENIFLDMVTIDKSHDKIDGMNVEKIEKMIKESITTLYASGPYGRFCVPKETHIFEDLADEFSDLEFNGLISGFIYETNYEIKADYKDNKLNVVCCYYLEEYNEDTDTCEDLNFVIDRSISEKNKIVNYIENLGGSVSKKISSNIDYYICDDIESHIDEIEEIKSYGIKIISKKEFIEDFAYYYIYGGTTVKKEFESEKYEYIPNSRTKEKEINYAEKVAREISKKPEEIIFKDKSFVIVGLNPENGIFDCITDNGGIIKHSHVTMKTDYIIISDDQNSESIKIKEARIVKEKGVNIIALTVSEYKDILGIK